jgi:hypothetical protein
MGAFLVYGSCGRQLHEEKMYGKAEEGRIVWGNRQRIKSVPIQTATPL